MHPDLLDENIDLQALVKALAARILRFKLGEIIDSDDKTIQFGRYYNQIVYSNSSPERTFIDLGAIEIKVLKEEVTIGNGIVLPKKTVMIDLYADERTYNFAVEAVLEVLGQLRTLDKGHLPNYLRKFVNS